MPTSTYRSEQMANDLRGQEERGMAKYATDEPSETWGAEFWRKMDDWTTRLMAYERQELADALAAPGPAARDGGGR